MYQTYDGEDHTGIVAASSNNDADNTITVWKKPKRDLQLRPGKKESSLQALFGAIRATIQFLTQLLTIAFAVKLAYDVVVSYRLSNQLNTDWPKADHRKATVENDLMIEFVSGGKREKVFVRKVVVDILNATHDHVLVFSGGDLCCGYHVIMSCVQYINDDFSHEHLFPLSTTNSPPL
ncbi:hypothetical protein M404DRAFT_24350 [Pisolithus tinctorius Marx 270]|uniref:Uncharacterized protein n=1 Tax=Pisolithus tinctorius Marx 270 TaxID=870435 RepID=A0A0C3PEH8_PISTI|nr:hypothetical protein M404DRAFT_24350 [Pisolithus tinctorius Marx 270]